MNPLRFCHKDALVVGLACVALGAAGWRVRSRVSPSATLEPAPSRAATAGESSAGTPPHGTPGTTTAPFATAPETTVHPTAPTIFRERSHTRAPASAAAAVSDVSPAPFAARENFSQSAPATERRANEAVASFGRIRQPVVSNRAPAAPTLPPPASGLVVELAPGMQAPAALAATDPKLTLTPGQEMLKDRLAGGFADAIEGALADPAMPPEGVGEVWVSAQEKADAHFRAMFGDSAFIQQKAAAAREALLQ